TEDAAIDRKLAELEKKHGRRPNLIHIMWDDTPLGEIGIPEIQILRGFETPNMSSRDPWSRARTTPASIPRTWASRRTRTLP
ncbi:MAG: hypothetical protein O7A09_10660, partial [Proteobacteria bacterium]|nr:hypothetical protein [Pseudomonadota bacterium]